jgi:hypothetical protein
MPLGTDLQNQLLQGQRDSYSWDRNRLGVYDHHVFAKSLCCLPVTMFSGLVMFVSPT